MLTRCRRTSERGWTGGPGGVRVLQLFHGDSMDLTATKVYGTLLGLESAGIVAHAEHDGVECYTLTPQGRGL